MNLDKLDEFPQIASLIATVTGAGALHMKASTSPQPFIFES